MRHLPPVLISQPTIQKRVRELARRISADYRNKKPVLIGVLKGVFVFLADLIRHLRMMVECDFVSLSSYGTKTVSSGKIKCRQDISLMIKGRDVIIIEDIIDSGRTLKYLVTRLKKYQPQSIRVCTLLDKPSQREVEVKIDYIGFKIPNKFVVGYGIDYNEQYRNLPYVGYLKK